MNVHYFRLAEAMGKAQMFHSEDGDKARHAFNKFADTSAPGDVIVIDCADVDIFDASFVGAFFAQVIVSFPVSYAERVLLVSGLNNSTRMNVDLCLDKLGVLLAEIDNGEASLLGRRATSDIHTFEFMMAQKEPLSVREFAERMKINVTAANERLSKLAKMAILQRFATTGGRTQQLYAAPSL